MKNKIVIGWKIVFILNIRIYVLIFHIKKYNEFEKKKQIHPLYKK